ncbi:MAG TPA: CehA/McbA family metallohydrolase [Trebonia sp.]
MGSLTKHTGMFTLEDRIAGSWHYLPVEVPAGTSALRVALSYPRESGAVLDLGCFAPAGFRGWSGGARDSFVLSEPGATPGYLAGPVTAGLWQVAIGLHALPEPGVPFTVTAEAVDAAGGALFRALAAGGAVEPATGAAAGDDPAGGVSGPGTAPLPAAPAERPARRPLPAADGLTWLAGDLHAHTRHSDGALSVAELARYAAERGLDFVAVTDHNTVSHHACLGPLSARYGVTLLPGQEVTTQLGHAGVLGDTGWIDFREPAASWLTAAESAGGLMSVNHPFAGPVSWVHPMPRRPPLLEVWHWSWLDRSWTTPLSWWQAWDPAAIPVGGSDWHRPGDDAPLGTPTTWVACADASSAGVLDGLRAGRVSISESRDGAVLLRDSGSLVAVGADGLVLAGPDGPRRRITGDLVRLPDAPGYHRLLTPAGATVALTP